MKFKRGQEAIESLLNNENEHEEQDRLVIEFRVGEAIAKRGLSQREVARMTGLRPNAVSNLARGDIERLSIDHLERIAAALNIEDITELMRFNVESEVTGLGYDAEQRRIQDAINDIGEEKDGTE
jgi:transcriptional regulator with XRE-family HTH domain